MSRSARAGLFVVCVAALTLAGCGSVGPGRSASGKTGSKQLNTAGVTRLEVGSAFDVRVTLGQPETATVTYDDKLADLLDSGTLRIQLKPHATVRIQAAGASAVTVSGRLQASGLRVEISSASRIAAELGLDRANATVSGASHLALSGTAGTLTAVASGASGLDLADLSLHDLDVQLSGASHASVQVDQTIAAQLSGASTLTYKGNPQFTKRDTSGASTIQPA
jgi:hypothetical protein